MVHITRKRFDETPVLVPESPDKQQRIVEAIEEQFSRLDAGVESLQRTKRNLALMRASVLKAAVDGHLTERRTSGDLGASVVERAEEARRIEQVAKHPGRKYKPAVDAVCDGPLPVGWALASLDQISLFVTDGDHRPPARTPTGVPHLTAKNVREGRLSFEDTTFVSPEGFEQTRARYEPAHNDLIITCVGTVGETAVVPPGVIFSADRNLAAARFAESGPRPQWVEIVLNAPRWRQRLRSASGSTAQPHLYLRDLRAIPIPVPPLEEQDDAISEVERQLSILGAIDDAVASGERRASLLRRAVLADAFAGRLLPSSGRVA